MSTLPWLLLSAMTCGASPDAVLLDFTAKWCGPCQQMSPIVSRLHRQGHPIFAVDVDQRPDLVKKYGISSIPAFVLIVDGKVARRVVGSTSESELKRMLAMIPPKPPKVPETLPNAPIFVKSDQTPRRTESGQPARRLAAAPQKPAPRFQLPFISGNSKDELEPTKPVVVRAKIDDEPLLTGRLPASVTPMSVSTRIRISDKSSVSFGSGTIIDSRIGVTRVLTCGHIFRKLAKDALIEVDVFFGDKKRTYVGKPVRYDLDSDVGLIIIPTDTILPAMRVAPRDFQITKGMGAQSVGCGGGDDPTLQDVKVLTIDRYRGPATLECTNVPVQGRSGGGLFAGEEFVIGVCMAAIPDEKRGLYSGLRAIQDFLDECQLSELYKAQQPEATLPKTIIVESDTFAEDVEVASRSAAEFASANGVHDLRPELDQADFDAPDLEPASVRIPASRVSMTSPSSNRNAPPKTPRSFEEIANDDDLEVICVIRKKGAPSSTNQVFVFDKPTPDFVDFLTRSSDSKQEPTMTSLQFDNPTRPAETQRPSSTRSSTRWAEAPSSPSTSKTTQRYSRQR